MSYGILGIMFNEVLFVAINLKKSVVAYLHLFFTLHYRRFFFFFYITTIIFKLYFLFFEIEWLNSIYIKYYILKFISYFAWIQLHSTIFNYLLIADSFYIPLDPKLYLGNTQITDIHEIKVLVLHFHIKIVFNAHGFLLCKNVKIL